MDIQQRLEEFFQRLQAAPPAATADEALALVCRLVEEVEDELCSFPREDPPPLHFTGRMYAPQADHIWPQPDGSIIASARHHEIYCYPDGAIVITHTPQGVVVLRKEARGT